MLCERMLKNGYLYDILLWIVYMIQDMAGLEFDELLGCLTNSVTYTRGEAIRRNYTQAQAEGS